MTRATKNNVKGAKATRRRRTEEFKWEALGLAEKIGVDETARELGLHSSQPRLTRQRRSGDVATQPLELLSLFGPAEGGFKIC